MNAIQARLESARFRRKLLWIGALILAAGVVVLVLKLDAGSGTTSVKPDAGFKPQLPAKTIGLKNHRGELVKYYEQLDPEIKQTIRRFIATAVARKHLERSWAVVSPSMKQGYTFKSWSHAKALPVVPYHFASLDAISYHLEQATTKEILLLAGLPPSKKTGVRPITFRIGLVPAGKGHKWLVDYWMPRSTAIIPAN